MTAMRFRHRHVHKTVFEFLKTEMTALGWAGPTGVPFGSVPIVWADYQPEDRSKDLEPNLVAVSMGDEPEDVVEELGGTFGGLESVSIPVFVDIYGEEEPISVAIAGDIKQSMKNQIIPLLDFTTNAAGVAVPSANIEFDKVEGPRKPAAAHGATDNLKRNWRVVYATAVVYFQD